MTSQTPPPPVATIATIPSLGWCRGARENQEDCFGVWGDGHRLTAVVADGMGGHQHGDLASKWLVEEIGRLAGQDIPFIERLARGTSRAVERMKRKGGAMGATLVAVEIAHQDGGVGLSLTWVGDSRIYLLTTSETVSPPGVLLARQGPHQLRLLTADDSFVWGFFTRGELTLDQLTRHPFKNQLERSVGGMSPGTDVVLRERCLRLALEPTDRVLLCSDGMWESFERQQDLLPPLASAAPDLALLDHLRREGARGNLHDNVTWLVLTAETAASPWIRLPRPEDERLGMIVQNGSLP